MEQRNTNRQLSNSDIRQLPQELRSQRAEKSSRQVPKEKTKEHKDLVLEAENRALSRDIASYKDEKSETRKTIIGHIAVSSVDWAWKKSGLRKSLTEQVMSQTEQTYEIDATRHEATAKKMIVAELLRNHPAEIDFLMLQGNRSIPEIRDDLERLAQNSIESLSAKLNRQTINGQGEPTINGPKKTAQAPTQPTSFLGKIAGWLK